MSRINRQFGVDSRKKELISKAGIKVPFNPKFSFRGKAYSQITVQKFEQHEKSKMFRIVGYVCNTPWYQTMEKLYEAIDWEWIERNYTYPLK